jgi:hypothetical protein
MTGKQNRCTHRAQVAKRAVDIARIDTSHARRTCKLPRQVFVFQVDKEFALQPGRKTRENGTVLRTSTPDRRCDRPPFALFQMHKTPFA